MPALFRTQPPAAPKASPFDLAGDYEYPQDYPELGDTITVIGTFEIHEQEGMQFCRLRDAEFVQ